MAASKTYLNLRTVTEETAEQLKLMLGRTYVTHNNLVFPCYSAKTSSKYAEKTRLSEQEARLVFLLELQAMIKQNNLAVDFSVETPTTLAYTGFTKGSRPQVFSRLNIPKTNGRGRPSSGESDVSIYVDPNKVEIELSETSLTEEISSFRSFHKEGSDHDIVSPSIRIEFRYGTSDKHSTEKDLLKLFAEDAVGIWFHLYIDKPGGAKRQSTKKAIIEKLTFSRGEVLKTINEYNAANRMYPNIAPLNPNKEVYVILVGLQSLHSSSGSICEFFRLSNWTSC